MNSSGVVLMVLNGRGPIASILKPKHYGFQFTTVHPNIGFQKPWEALDVGPRNDWMSVAKELPLGITRTFKLQYDHAQKDYSW